jgi:MFS transporter, Spinster family, sphingosine-1-phosphate transporter
MMTRPSATSLDSPAGFSQSYIRYVLFLLLLAHTLNFIDRQIINILAHPIQQELGLSDTQLGLLTGLAFALFYSILGIPIARYADNKKSHRPMIIGISILLWSAMTALCGMAQNFIQLVLARVGVGVGEAGCTPPAHSLIGDYLPPEKRASAIAFYGLGLPAGGLLGMLIGGTLADLYGWRAALYAVGLPGVLLGIVVMLTLREPRRVGLGATSAAPVAPTLPSNASSSLKTIFETSAFRWLIVGAALLACLSYGKTVWSMILFTRLHGLSPGQVGLYYGVTVGIAGMIGMWLGGQLGDRFGRRDPRYYLTLPAIAIAITTPLLSLGYLVDDWRLALLLLFLPAVASSLYYGPTFAVVQLLIKPENRAFAVSIILLIANLVGAGLGPLFFGMLSDALDIHCC